MKKLFILALVLQGLVETVVGLLMVTTPGSFAPDAVLTELFQYRNQGFIALSIGVATLMLWFQRGNAAVIGFAAGYFVVYHMLVTASGAINATMGFDFAPMMLHVVLGLLFLVVWLRREQIAF